VTQRLGYENESARDLGNSERSGYMIINTLTRAVRVRVKDLEGRLIHRCVTIPSSLALSYHTSRVASNRQASDMDSPRTEELRERCGLP
jgi:hypothetical protein